MWAAIRNDFETKYQCLSSVIDGITRAYVTAATLFEEIHRCRTCDAVCGLENISIKKRCI